MHIDSLKLRNIRSYEESSVSFQEGTTLLSGDIGCGKTSILLAIEFALFGVIRGSVSASSLLRTGCKEGEVELSFSIRKHKYIIGRKLKRTTNGITQAAGYLIKDDVKQDLTAIELKSKILTILGYPEELVTKSKSLIYRYTVYTPQEEMKHILFENPDERLNTLRSVFGIDKYKTCRENLALYTKEMRITMKLLSSKFDDERLVKNVLEETKKILSKIKKGLDVLMPKKEKAEKEVQKAKSVLESLDDERQKAITCKNTITMLSDRVEDIDATIEKKKEQKAYLQEDLKHLEEEISTTKVLDRDYDKLLEQQQEKLARQEEKLVTISEQKARISSKIDEQQDIKTNMDTLEQCPVCLQKVDEKHKHHINKKADDLIEQQKEKIPEINNQLQTTKSNIEILKNNIKKIHGRIEEKKIFSMNKKQFNEKKQLIEGIEQEMKDAADRKKATEEQLQQTKKELAGFKHTEKNYEKQKALIDTLQASLQTCSVEEARLMATKNAEEKRKTEAESKINELEEIRKKRDRMKALHDWLTQYLDKVFLVMEKRVMASLQQQFNDAFIELFDNLIEDDAINASIDEQFSPEVIQNGYDIEAKSMSGGEKTSLALAYRLALNKVINDFVSHITTKDIIILDEPTDGFSSEQLDKLKDVFDNLHINQCIVVSHESKLESMADHVLRITKEEHVSQLS